MNLDPYLAFRGLIFGGGLILGRKFVVVSIGLIIGRDHIGGANIKDLTVYLSYIQNRLFKYLIT